MRKDLDTSDMLSKLKENLEEMDDRTLFSSLGITIEQMISRRALTLPMPEGRGFLAQPPQPAPARSYAMSPSV